MTSLRWSMTRRRVNNGLYLLKRKIKQKYEPRDMSHNATIRPSSIFKSSLHTTPDRMRQIRHCLKCIWILGCLLDSPTTPGAGHRAFQRILY